jgi:hypothetical protein
LKTGAHPEPFHRWNWEPARRAGNRRGIGSLFESASSLIAGRRFGLRDVTGEQKSPAIQ